MNIQPFSKTYDGVRVLSFPGLDLEPGKNYTVVTDDYLQRGTGYPSLAVPDEAARFDKRFIRDLVQEYLTDGEVFRTASIPRDRGKQDGI